MLMTHTTWIALSVTHAHLHNMLLRTHFKEPYFTGTMYPAGATRPEVPESKSQRRLIQNIKCLSFQLHGSQMLQFQLQQTVDHLTCRRHKEILPLSLQFDSHCNNSLTYFPKLKLNKSFKKVKPNFKSARLCAIRLLILKQWHK